MGVYIDQGANSSCVYQQELTALLQVTPRLYPACICLIPSPAPNPSHAQAGPWRTDGPPDLGYSDFTKGVKVGPLMLLSSDIVHTAAETHPWGLKINKHSTHSFILSHVKTTQASNLLQINICK